jgi:uncharacterized Fe-S radical SAM superfamily protein PflX
MAGRHTGRLRREHRASEEEAAREAEPRGASGAASWTSCAVCGVKVRTSRLGQHRGLCKTVRRSRGVSDDTLRETR